MFEEIVGYRVNLIYIAIIVALYDIAHIVLEFYNRFELVRIYENTEYGCINDFSQPHCKAVNFN